jgi:hypothetical protein
MTDWFLPRLTEPVNGRHEWWVRPEDEKTLHTHLAYLCRLGIPSFLIERHNKSLMKLFMCPEAYVREASVPPPGDQGAKVAFWSGLKNGFLEFCVHIMAKEVMQMFPENNNTRRHLLMAVFDASGYSPDVDRWKLSFRICFFEIPVTCEGALQARDLFVSKLDSAWEHLQEHAESWVAAVEPIQRPASSADSQCSFWAPILDEGPFRIGAQHRLVFCDTVSGDKTFLLPEGRPLMPRCLYKAKMDANTGRVSVSLHVSENMSDADWAEVGSVWTTYGAPIEPWQRSNQQQSRSSASQQRSAQRSAATSAQSPQQGRPTQIPTWKEYRSPEGQPYYYNTETGKTSWTDPVHVSWEEFRNENGIPYYHNRYLEKTEWTLPEGAQIQRRQGG